MSATFSLAPIGHVHTPFQEKFGIPRQPGLVEVPGMVEMLPGYDKPEMFDGLEAFSHIWVTFVFHQSTDQGWRVRVRPPRLGGNQRKGIFATRSPFRPNHLGLSVLQLDRIENQAGRVRLHVRGVDLLDGTPIVDIKPYIPYADAIPQAKGGFAPQAPSIRLQVVFSDLAQEQLNVLPDGNKLSTLIKSLLALDPRPAYRQIDDESRVYGMRLSGCNVRWQVSGNRVCVLDVAAQTAPQ